MDSALLKFGSILFFFFAIQKTNGQSSKIQMTSLNQKISYYQNGNIYKIESFFLKDSCHLRDENGFEIISDTCHYGIFKEYYPNGILKILGQYDCNIWNAKIKQKNEFYGIEPDCFKTGTWHEFDSLGRLELTNFYSKGSILFYEYPLKRDTIDAKKDSVILKIKHLSIQNSYVVRRFKTNKYLLFDTNNLYHAYFWLIYDGKINIQPNHNNNDYHNYSLSYQGKRAAPKSGKYIDFSKLKNGKYYVYLTFYWNIRYGIEVILEDME